MPLRTTMMRLLVALVSCTVAHATDWADWEVRPQGYQSIRITNKLSTPQHLALAAGDAFVEDGTHQTLVVTRGHDYEVRAYSEVLLPTYCMHSHKSVPKRRMTRTPSQVCVSRLLI